MKMQLPTEQYMLGVGLYCVKCETLINVEHHTITEHKCKCSRTYTNEEIMDMEYPAKWINVQVTIEEYTRDG